jgi:hypothetical protein
MVEGADALVRVFANRGTPRARNATSPARNCPDRTRPRSATHPREALLSSELGSGQMKNQASGTCGESWMHSGVTPTLCWGVAARLALAVSKEAGLLDIIGPHGIPIYVIELCRIR